MPGKYFYVWLDAPIGYIASLENHLRARNDESAEEIWSETANTEIYHFIGDFGHAGVSFALISGSSFQNEGFNEQKAVCGVGSDDRQGSVFF